MLRRRIAGMRVSQHSGRQGSAKHNDRNFDLRKAPHIDEARTGNNVVGSLRGLKGATLEEQELDYYQRVYGAGIDARNKRYLAQRHPERCKTPEAYYRGSKTRPEEMILQIGSHVDGSATPEQLRTCLQEYLAELQNWNQEHGFPFQILNYALHTDETTPHIHLRRVWNTVGKDGTVMPGQNAALEQAGVPLPDPTKPIGRYNNRKQTFDAWSRALWQKIARKHGFEIETIPVKGRKHLPVDDKARELSMQASRDLKQAADAIQKAQKELSALQGEIRQAEGRLTEIRANVADMERIAQQYSGEVPDTYEVMQAHALDVLLGWIPTSTATAIRRGLDWVLSRRRKTGSWPTRREGTERKWPGSDREPTSLSR